MSAQQARGVIEATVFALVGVAILIGLGIWQLDRKVWKENLIATLNTRLARAPQDLPPRADWARLTADRRHEFTRVTFPAEFLAGEEALVYTAGSAFRPDVQGPGYWVFAPARLAGRQHRRGRPRLRAARPQGSGNARARHAAAAPSILSASCAGRKRAACSRRPTIRKPMSGICAIPTPWPPRNKWDAAAPFYIEQEQPVPPGGLPKPGKLAVSSAGQSSAIRASPGSASRSALPAST